MTTTTHPNCPMCGRGHLVPAYALHVATDADLVCDYCGFEAEEPDVETCPNGHGEQPATSRGQGPGFTGARIYWATLACGCNWVDASGDNLEAVR